MGTLLIASSNRVLSFYLKDQAVFRIVESLPHCKEYYEFLFYIEKQKTLIAFECFCNFIFYLICIAYSMCQNIIGKMTCALVYKGFWSRPLISSIELAKTYFITTNTYQYLKIAKQQKNIFLQTIIWSFGAYMCIIFCKFNDNYFSSMIVYSCFLYHIWLFQGV